MNNNGSYARDSESNIESDDDMSITQPININGSLVESEYLNLSVPQSLINSKVMDYEQLNQN